MADNDRRELDQHEQSFLDELTFQNERMRGVVRGVGAEPDVEDAGDLLGAARMQGKADIGTVRAVPEGGLGLMFCRLLGNDFDKLYDAVVEAVADIPNTDPIYDTRNKQIAGNYYQYGRHCEFLMSLYEEQDSSAVLDFKRMSGDGFVMDGWFCTVKDKLQSTGIMDKEAQEEILDDLMFSEDEDGDEELASYLRPGGYLQLKYDRKLVRSWITKLPNRIMEDRNHMMGLMAHNASNPENRKIMVEQGGADLANCCAEILSEKLNAALSRNTSVLLKELTLESNFEFPKELIVVMISSLFLWCPSDASKKRFEIKESRETVRYLTETLHILSERDNVNFDFSSFNEVLEETGFDDEEQKTDLRDFLAEQDNDASAFLLEQLD